MKKHKQSITSYMVLEYPFSGVRLQDKEIVPVDWHLTISLVAVGRKNQSREEVEHQASIAYQKIYFWLDVNLQNILVVDATSPEDLYIANLTANVMLYCPDVASDDTMIQLLHSKITVLAGADLLVGDIHIKGSDTSLQYVYDCPEEGYNLPATASEYIINGIPRDELPWWSRNDGFSFEFVKPADTLLTDEEIYKDIIDPMLEFDEMLRQSEDKAVTIAREPAKIVKIDVWSPKKV